MSGFKLIVIWKRVGVRKINEQDETVLLETKTVREQVKDHTNKNQVKINKKRLANSKKTAVIRVFPFVLFFISLCILIIYLGAIRD